MNTFDGQGLLAATAIAAGLLASGCGRTAVPSELPAGQSVPVAVAVVRAEQVPLPCDAVGVVRPVRSARVAARLMGAIASMPVALGQRVASGQVLATLDAREVAARAAEAQAELATVRRDLDRERSLLSQAASTPQIVKDLTDRFAGAEAAVREAETMVGYTVVRAPFAGVVAAKFAEVGDLASPGEPLVEIEDAAGFEVDAQVPESLAAGLVPGARLQVEIPGAGGATFIGKVKETSSAADPETHTVLTKVDVPAGIGVRSGEYARVQVPGPLVAELVAPASAVSPYGQVQRVFVVGPDERAVLRLVRTGAALQADAGGAAAAEVDLLSGVEAGERIVVAPPPGLAEGERLDIRP